MLRVCTFKGWLNATLCFVVFGSAVVHAERFDFYYATYQQAFQACWAKGTCNSSYSPRYVSYGGNIWYFHPYLGTYNCAANGKVFTAPSGQCREDPFSASECADSGYGYSSGSCNTDPPQCSIGQSYQSGVGCAYPAEAPESCGDDELAVVGSDGVIKSCTPLLNPNLSDGGCDRPLGYSQSGGLLCDDRRDQCEQGGGTAGYMGSGSNMDFVCIGADYEPDTCSFGSSLQVAEGGFVCGQVSDVQPPNPDETKNPDTKKPGGCDASTSDCDGDGQTDQPGEGNKGLLTNGIDPHSGTPETSKTGQAAASNSCAQAPACSGGDPQVCALLRQQWETMCNQGAMLQDVDDSQRDVLEGKARDAISGFDPTSAEGGYGSEGIGGDLGSSGEGPLSSEHVGVWQSFVSDLIPGGGSCSDLSFTVTGSPEMSWQISCSDAAPVRAVLAWLFYVLTAWYTFKLAFEPIER